MTAEPTAAGSIGITALLIALLGPVGGEYATIVFAALAGAMWPLLTMKDATRMQAVGFLLRVVITAVVLTGSATYYLENHYGFPARHGMSVVAFVIGSFGNGWGPVLDGLRDALQSLLQRVMNQKADGGGQT
jgi:hypothetical protein